MKITEIDLGWNAIVKELKKLDNTTIEVGVLENAPKYKSANMASVAFWNEHGTKNIPPRPFLRPSLEGVNMQRLMQLQKTLIAQLESRTPLSFSKVLKEVGENQKKLIQWIILRKSSPANKESTVRQKGFNDPLIHTYKLHDNIKWKRKK